MFLDLFRKKMSPKNPQKYKVQLGRICINNQKIDLRKTAKEYSFCDFVSCDFSNNNNIYWLQKKKFFQCSFKKVSFGAMADHGNCFENCLFECVDFRQSILGYDATIYVGCTFLKVKFHSFIKPYFKDCKFINCYFNDVDFNASRFERCDFNGIVDSAWFRGGFPSKEDVKEFGKAQQNKMEEVSFADTELHHVHFSDNCDLSTIILPKRGHYLFFDDWDRQLNAIKKCTVGNINQDIVNDINDFTELHKIYSDSQMYYLINIVDLEKLYCKLAVDIIRKKATLEINDGVITSIVR